LDQPSLIVVGTGIRIIGQMTIESIAWIRMAEKVFYLAHDPVAGEVITGLNANAESLAGLYVEGKLRRKSLSEMVERVMECVRSGARICLVFYGHPGVFCWVGHEAVRQARRAGYRARMLPGISAEDCLFADLNLDPGTHGCQSYDATDFLNYRPRIDPASLLILWQIGATGNPLFSAKQYKHPGLPVLLERLCRIYGPDHEVIVYVAPIHWAAEPLIERMPLRQLGKAPLSSSSTLCIPPARSARREMEVDKRLKRARTDEAAHKRSVRRRTASAKRAASVEPVRR
jgi:Tetrapyrrole (Corrin/Porphyrin) Methylases